MVQKVTVLGGGNAGFALTFHLSHRGFQVALFEHPNFASTIESVKKTGEIVALPELEGYKAHISGRAKLALATTDIKTAVEFGDVIMTIVPAFGQVPMFEMALPYMRANQIIVSMPGNFASLQYADLMKSREIQKRLYFVDTDTIPYACRKLKDNQIFISMMKRMLYTGVYPAEATDKVLAELQPFFALKLHKVNNVLAAGFGNLNMVVHPPPVLLNVGWIEATEGAFRFYGRGCSPSVCRVMDAIDAERVAVARALGIETETLLEIHKGWYGETGIYNTYEHIHACSFYGFIDAPSSLQHRYIDEDMCYVLVPIAKIAKRYGIPTPNIDALVTIAETLTGKKLEAKRSFDHVVKDGEGIEQMRQRLSDGWLPRIESSI